MSVYLVATITIHDRQTYARYEAGFMDIFSQYDGKMLAVDDHAEVLEGNWDHSRTVLVEFPSSGQARAWAIGVRISGLPNWASTEPSRYSTIECTMLCG